MQSVSETPNQKTGMTRRSDKDLAYGYLLVDNLTAVAITRPVFYFGFGFAAPRFPGEDRIYLNIKLGLEADIFKGDLAHCRIVFSSDDGSAWVQRCYTPNQPQDLPASQILVNSDAVSGNESLAEPAPLRHGDRLCFLPTSRTFTFLYPHGTMGLLAPVPVSQEAWLKEVKLRFQEFRFDSEKQQYFHPFPWFYLNGKGEFGQTKEQNRLRQLTLRAAANDNARAAVSVIAKESSVTAAVKPVPSEREQEPVREPVVSREPSPAASPLESESELDSDAGVWRFESSKLPPFFRRFRRHCEQFGRHRQWYDHLRLSDSQIIDMIDGLASKWADSQLLVSICHDIQRTYENKCVILTVCSQDLNQRGYVELAENRVMLRTTAMTGRVVTTEPIRLEPSHDLFCYLGRLYEVTFSGRKDDVEMNDLLSHWRREGNLVEYSLQFASIGIFLSLFVDHELPAESITPVQWRRFTSLRSTLISDVELAVTRRCPPLNQPGSVWSILSDEYQKRWAPDLFGEHPPFSKASKRTAMIESALEKMLDITDLQSLARGAFTFINRVLDMEKLAAHETFHEWCFQNPRNLRRLEYQNNGWPVMLLTALPDPGYVDEWPHLQLHQAPISDPDDSGPLLSAPLDVGVQRDPETETPVNRILEPLLKFVPDQFPERTVWENLTVGEWKKYYAENPANRESDSKRRKI